MATSRQQAVLPWVGATVCQRHSLASQCLRIRRRKLGSCSQEAVWREVWGWPGLEAVVRFAKEDKQSLKSEGILWSFCK